METFENILDAFANGTGDVFFRKGNKYVALSRHDGNIYADMNSQGFEFVPHDEVMQIANLQNPPKPIKQIPVSEPARTKKFIHYDCGYNQSYYDEFPDAYNQHL